MSLRDLPAHPNLEQYRKQAKEFVRAAKAGDTRAFALMREHHHHFEGRSFPGWHHHVVLTAVAYAFLQRERMRDDVEPTLTLPAARAIVTEIFTALLFAQKPYYLKRIQELQKIQLRI